MATGKNIEKRSHIIGFKEEIDKASKKNGKSFWNWFDESGDKETAFIRGSWDFSFHIANRIAPFIQNPENKTCLDYGHGGGRMIFSACRHFKYNYGCDIHNCNELVKEEIESRGSSNFKLIQGNGENVPLANNSVDVVYSFIVLAHVEKIRIYKNIINEFYRVLNKNGICIIYFARPAKFSLGKKGLFMLILDKILEFIITFPKGYLEKERRVNETNLYVTNWFAKKFCKKLGFKVLKTYISRKRVPNGANLYGGQNCLILKKI